MDKLFVHKINSRETNIFPAISVHMMCVYGGHSFHTFSHGITFWSDRVVNDCILDRDCHVFHVLGGSRAPLRPADDPGAVIIRCGNNNSYVSNSSVYLAILISNLYCTPSSKLT
jgi:hypothetical protein